MDLTGLNTGVAWSRRPRIFGAWDGAGVLLAESLKTDSNQPTNQQKVRVHLHAFLTCAVEGSE